MGGKMPATWPYLMKHFIPQVLIILFFNLTGSRNVLGETLFGHYGAYPFPYQMIGILVVVLVITILLIGLKRPDSLTKIAALEEQPMFSNSRYREGGVDSVYLEMPEK